MKKGTHNLMSVALKYFFLLGLRPAWLILQVVDPFVGPTAASAILTALNILGFIEYEVPIQVDESGNNESKESNTDEHANGSNNNQMDSYWNIESKTHAAQTVTMAQYKKFNY